MADTKLTGLASLSAVPDDADYVYVVDVSDTSMAASGTSKKNLAKYFIRSNGTANTLGANINANSNNITGVGTLQCTLLGESWLNLSFNTGWGNLGGGYQNCQYKKIGDIVHVRGIAKRTSGTSNLIGTLPSGYRPLGTNLITTTSNDAYGIVQIDAAGDITLLVGVATAYVDIDNVSFSVI